MGWPITRPSVIYAIRCKTSSRVYIGRTYRLEARLKEHFSELRRGMKTWYAAEEGRHISQFQPVIEGLPPKRKTKEPKRKTKEHPLVAESAAVKEE